MLISEIKASERVAFASQKIFAAHFEFILPDVVSVM